jgi:mono/diheme cytochrome c family protein
VWLLVHVTVSGTARQASPASSSNLNPPATVQFNRDIRPILSDKCFTCHGPDKAKRVTQFHFDVEEAAKQPLPGGRFVVRPGDPANSVLIQRITATDQRQRMPPVATGKTLTEREIALLTAWIRQGARWEKPWAFETPVRPPVPQVADGAWPSSPIDAFVLERLQREGLRPSPEADRETLLRRVTLDLTGKGPTIAEIDSFIEDTSANA